MKKNVIIVLLACIFSSCTQSWEAVSGKPYDILKPEVYNELQKLYSSISDFDSGTAIVKDGKAYGLIDSKGKNVLPCQYDTIYPLYNDMRIVRSNELYGMVGLQGNICISCVYEDVHETVCTDYLPFKRNGKWGFLSRDEETVVQFKYDDVYRFTDSTFVAEMNGKCGLFTYTGKCILEPKYDKIAYKVLNKQEDPSFVVLNDKLAVLNSRNEFVTGFEYSAGLGLLFFSFPQEGMYVEVSKVVSSKLDCKKHRYGLLNYETGALVIPCEYESLGDVSEGLLYAEKDDRYGYIDVNNKVIIPFKYKDAENFSEGLARVAVHGGYYNSISGEMDSYSLYGFIDKTGKFVIPPTFPDPRLNDWGGDGFYEGLAAMGRRPHDNIYAHYFGYIDVTGKYVIAPIYDEAHRFMHGIALVCKNEKYGCIDKNGNVVVDLIYDGYEHRAEKDTVIVLEKANQKYAFKFDGTPVQ